MNELLTTRACSALRPSSMPKYAGGWNFTIYCGGNGKKNERFTSPNAELASSLCPAGSSRNDSRCLDRLASRYEDDGAYTLHNFRDNFQLRLLSMGWEVYLFGVTSVRGNPRPILKNIAYSSLWTAGGTAGTARAPLGPSRGYPMTLVRRTHLEASYRLEVLDRVYSAATPPSCVPELATGRQRRRAQRGRSERCSLECRVWR
jgi:hypothetical protein